MKMIRLIASAYIGMMIMMLALAWWQGLWWELVLVFLGLWADNAHKDLVKRRRIEAELQKYLKKDSHA